MKMFALAGVIAVTLVSGAPWTPPAAAAPDAHAIVARWRAAVRTSNASQALGVLSALETTHEIGLDGKLTVVVTADGRYYQSAERAGDRTEVVLTPHGGWSKDWNGDVRALEGDELKRERA